MREASGIATKLVVTCVREWAGDAAVAELTEQADLSHRGDELEDEAAWISFADLVALLEAARVVLDDPDAPHRIGRSIVRAGVARRGRLFMRALGSPTLVYRELPRAASKFTNVIDVEPLAAGRGRARVRLRYHDGVDPAPSYDAFADGLMCAVPEVFGAPPARSTRAPDSAGDPRAAVVELRWRDVTWRPGLPRRRRRVVEAERDLLVEQLQDLQRTVADLVAQGDVDELLDTVVARTVAAVQAPRALLTVRLEDEPTPRVFAHGIDDGEAAEVAAALFADAVSEGESRSVAEVASAQCSYGHLLVWHPPGFSFYSGERELLAAYARLAASALDGLTAIRAAQRGQDMANALLGLARDLVATTTVQDVADQLVEAVRRLADAEVALVLLAEPVPEPHAHAAIDHAHAAIDVVNDASESPARVALRLRLAAHAGVDVAVAERVADPPEGECARRWLDEQLEAPEIRLFTREVVDDPCVERAMTALGCARVAVVPLRRGDVGQGVVVAGWEVTEGHGRDEDVVARLAGVADHGTIALRSARSHDDARHQAVHDALTGLANRELFLERVDAALAHPACNPSRVYVLFIDLDDFKPVNDAYGHDVGDEVLRRLATRIRHAIRPEDLPARLSGDEFAVVLECVDDPEVPPRVAERLRDTLVQDVGVAGHRIRVSASIGLARGGPGTAAEDLVRAADTAMYAAKADGKGAVRVHEPGMRPRGDPGAAR